MSLSTHDIKLNSRKERGRDIHIRYSSINEGGRGQRLSRNATFLCQCRTFCVYSVSFMRRGK